jgi:hypothetical protein
MTEERKYAILFAATLLCARKLIEMDSDRPSPGESRCGRDNAIAMEQRSNDILRVDSSNSLSPARLSPRSLENLKNVKGVTCSHGPSMESPCLEAEAKNHSSPNLRLLLKRSWNHLSY